MRTEYHFFRMECTCASGATQIWRILNRRTGCLIGLIKWYAPWRQYCFWPKNVSVWSRGCLAEVEDFLRQLEDERKRRRIERAVEAKGEVAGLMALDRFFVTAEGEKALPAPKETA